MTPTLPTLALSALLVSGAVVGCAPEPVKHGAVKPNAVRMADQTGTSGYCWSTDGKVCNYKVVNCLSENRIWPARSDGVCYTADEPTP